MRPQPIHSSIVGGLLRVSDALDGLGVRDLEPDELASAPIGGSAAAHVIAPAAYERTK